MVSHDTRLSVEPRGTPARGSAFSFSSSLADRPRLAVIAPRSTRPFAIIAGRYRAAWMMDGGGFAVIQVEWLQNVG